MSAKFILRSSDYDSQDPETTGYEPICEAIFLANQLGCEGTVLGYSEVQGSLGDLIIEIGQSLPKPSCLALETLLSHEASLRLALAETSDLIRLATMEEVTV